MEVEKPEFFGILDSSICRLLELRLWLRSFVVRDGETLQRNLNPPKFREQLSLGDLTVLESKGSARMQGGCTYTWEWVYVTLDWGRWGVLRITHKLPAEIDHELAFLSVPFPPYNFITTTRVNSKVNNFPHPSRHSSLPCPPW